ncbi:MAG: NifB/NifX family molybdenum-iron cluster-binding protein [Bryobacterales bacterium]|nr:NifB/NifX family molybdenum-iron cluster-binding protein [Bryobacterales bacterium]
MATTIDFAHEILVVDCDHVRELRRKRHTLDDGLPTNLAHRIARLGIEVLICGAISRTLALMMSKAGILVIPLVSGPVDEVLAAFLENRIEDSRFLLSGCTEGDRQRLAQSPGPHRAG